MNRRGLLRLIGGVVAGGQGAVKTAAEMTVRDLSLRGMGLAGNGVNFVTGEEPNAGGGDRKKWALTRLAKLRLFGDDEVQDRKDQFWMEGLDPGVACLRSVALTSKVRMSREILFARSERREKRYLKRVIAGFVD